MKREFAGAFVDDEIVLEERTLLFQGRNEVVNGSKFYVVGCVKLLGRAPALNDFDHVFGEPIVLVVKYKYSFVVENRVFDRRHEPNYILLNAEPPT